MRRAFLLLALVAASAAAYDHPLGSHALREAFFLGSGSEEPLGSYTQTFSIPEFGPHVAEIEVRTPFLQVVAISREHGVGYSTQQAAQEYRRNPNTVQVRIEIRNTATFSIIPPPPKVPTLTGEEYPYPRWNRAELNEGACGDAILGIHPIETCFPGFHFRFNQGKEIKPKSSYSVPQHFYTGRGLSGLLGAEVWFVFSASDIASAPLRIVVSTPDGQEVSAEFDLASLR